MCMVRCLVEMTPALKPPTVYHGCTFEPACGSGGMFVQPEKFVASHGGKLRFKSDNAVNVSLN